MGRYWRIYRTFFASSLSRELEFRANFFAKVAQNVVWVGFFFAILLVIYGNTNSIAGWNRGDALVLAATVFLMNAISSAFFMSLSEIPEQVRQGTLDFIVTKPIDSQFWISARRFNFDQIGTLIAGVGLIAWGVRVADVSPSPAQWLGYVLLVTCALVLFYSMNLLLMTTGIWLVKVDNLWVLSESVVQVARYPLDIYGTGLQRVFTFAVPLGFLSTIPARQLVRGSDFAMVGLGLVWATAAFLAARTFWRYAMKHYASASS